MVGLSYRLQKTIDDRSSTLNRLDIVHSIKTFALQYKICSPDIFRIRKDKDTITTLHSPPCSIEQRFKIVVGFTLRRINVRLARHKHKLLAPRYLA